MPVVQIPVLRFATPCGPLPTDKKRLLLATGSADSTVQLWSVSPTEVTLMADPFVGHSGAVTTVLFGTLPEDYSAPVVFSGSVDNTVRVWKVTSERRVGQPLQGHRKAVQCLALVEHNQRVMLASGSEDRSTQVRCACLEGGGLGRVTTR